jgi:predicted Zn-dependent protease
MLNLVELERRWLQYKIKSYLPYLIIAISVIIIVIVLSILMSQSSDKIADAKTTISPIEKVEVPIKTIEQPTKQSPQIKPVHKMQNSETTKLSPSMDFMRKMQNSTQPYYEGDSLDRDEPSSQEQELKQRHQKIRNTVKEEEIIEEVVAPIEDIKPPESKKISIKIQNTQSDIKDIIRRFKKNNNPALSLFVAKKYYELGDYHKAYNYALMTNEINRDIEASWIIFAKSLVKLGKKDMAVKTLEKYINQSQSNSAKILLDEINSGKFK